MSKHRLKYLFLLLPVLLCAAAVLLSEKETTEIRSIPAASEEERLAYLRSEGWEGTLTDAQTVIIPPEDAVFAEYAALQRRQQLPLEAYAGQKAMRYTYALRDTQLYAELLTADGILIGAQCYAPEEHVTLPMMKGAF